MLCIATIVAVLVENISAIREVKYRGIFGVSPTYGMLQIGMIITYTVFLIVFSLTSKRRKSREFCLALFLLIATAITLMNFDHFSFGGSTSPYNYYKLVYNNPFVFYFEYYLSPIYGEDANYILTDSTYSLTLISAIVATVTMIISIIISSITFDNNKLISNYPDKNREGNK